MSITITPPERLEDCFAPTATECWVMPEIRWLIFALPLIIWNRSASCGGVHRGIHGCDYHHPFVYFCLMPYGGYFSEMGSPDFFLN